MKNTLILFLILICFAACAQKSQVNAKQVYLDSIQEQKEYLEHTIAFIAMISKNKPILLNDNLDNNEGFSCLDQLKQDTLTFTKSEIDYILKKSKNSSIKKWTKELVPVAKLINGDTINQIFKNGEKGWTYFYKKIGRDFTSFSAPIFLRNNKYCIFYSAIHCGWLCGGGQLILYKREGAEWKIVKSYCNWIS
jgi:hypothetical protein